MVSNMWCGILDSRGTLMRSFAPYHILHRGTISYGIGRTMYLCAYSYPCALSIIVVKVMVKVTQQRIMVNRATKIPS